MPEANLPNNLLGWIVAVGAGVIGFFAGFLFIALMRGVIGGS
jgi:3-dehydroquinate synthetase